MSSSQVSAFVALFLAGLLLVAACDTSSTNPTTTTVPAVTSSTTSTAPTDVEPQAIPQWTGAGLAVADSAVLFGGFNDRGVALNDTWKLAELDGAWVRSESSVVPQARGFHSMTPLGSTGTVLMLGGTESNLGTQCTIANCIAGYFFADLWQYDESDGWDQLEISTPLGLRAGHAAAYDPNSATVVFYGGMLAPEGSETAATLQGDTWLYSVADGAWIRVDGSGPEPRLFPQMVYHPPSRSVVLWGGYLGGSATDASMWTFDIGDRTWRAITPPPVAPESRWSHSTMYDPPSGDLVMTGGVWIESGSHTFGSDVWRYNLEKNEWSNQARQPGPLFQAASTTYRDVPLLYIGGSKAWYDSATDQWTWTIGDSPTHSG